MKRIEIIDKFTEESFLNTFLQYSLNKYESGERVIIDLSCCKWIDHEVIPDMLIFGEILKREKGIVAEIYVPRDGIYVQRIRNYLKDIHFIELAEQKGLFDVRYITDYMTKSDREDRMMPDYCMTCAYSIEDSCRDGLLERKYTVKEKTQKIAAIMEQEIANKYSGIFQNFLSQFFYGREENRKDGKKEWVSYNLIQYFITQIAKNSLVHGQQQVYISMQGNVMTNKCTISISDNGMGITRSLEEKIMEEKSALQQKKRVEKKILSILATDTFLNYPQFQKDVFASIEALAYRYDDTIYGLYNMLNEVLSVKGELHIHTGMALIILKEDCKERIINAENRSEFAMGLYNYLNQNRSNLIRTEEFHGTHVKLIIPIN